MNTAEADRQLRTALSARHLLEIARTEAYREIDTCTSAIMEAQHLIDRLLEERLKA